MVGPAVFLYLSSLLVTRPAKRVECHGVVATGAGGDAATLAALANSGDRRGSTIGAGGIVDTLRDMVAKSKSGDG